MTIQIKAIEQNIPVVLFIMRYKVVLSIKVLSLLSLSFNSNESYWALYFSMVLFIVTHGGSNFWESYIETIQLKTGVTKYLKIARLMEVSDEAYNVNLPPLQ